MLLSPGSSFMLPFLPQTYFSLPFFLANPPYALRCISGISSAGEPSDFRCPSIDFPSSCLIIIISNDNYPFRYWSSYKGSSMLFEDRYCILIIFPWSLAWCLAKNGHLVESNVERNERTRKEEERSRREMRGKGYDGVRMGWIRIEQKYGGEREENDGWYSWSMVISQIESVLIVTLYCYNTPCQPCSF